MDLIIPHDLKSCITNLRNKFARKKCDILGRDRECAFIWQTMQKKDKRNVILIGEPGVGKTAIMEKITYDIIRGNCPQEFYDFEVLSLDVTSMIAGTKFRGDAEQKFIQLIDFLEENSNVILYIDEIHLIMGAGKAEGIDTSLSNALKPIMAGDKIRIIGATTAKEYEEIICTDGAVKRRFRTIEVKEPRMREVFPMLQKTIESLSKYHGVSINKQMVDFIILNAACFDHDTRNPDRTKDLIDLSMVIAKQRRKRSVDKSCVLANFEYNFERLEKKSEHAKRMVAYHEAGHCVATMFSEYLIDRNVIAVSIMPTDTYEGITVSEYNDSYVEPTMNYYIDLIACTLAGRVSEKLYTGNISSGAAGDLEKATKVAYEVVTKYGLLEFGANRTYTSQTTTPEIVCIINKEIDKIIANAMKRAECIINENRTFMEQLVQKLLHDNIVSAEELSKLRKNQRNIFA